MTFIVMQSAASPLNERVLTCVPAFQVADLEFEYFGPWYTLKPKKKYGYEYELCCGSNTMN